MNKKILALCDTETAYLHHIIEYLQSTDSLPFAVYAFTSLDELKKFAKISKIEILLIAENSYKEEVEELEVTQFIILNESGNKLGKTAKNINKYQSLPDILREIIGNYIGEAKDIPRRMTTLKPIKIIGNYTPIRRCLQTTFSLCMGQVLAKNHKVLYLNFENYSGFTYLMDREFKRDITDVLYFLDCEKEKLSYRLTEIVESINELDFVPPVVSYKDLNTITGKQWIKLFREIEEASDYEYLILDLSEQVQGLFEILKQCFKVYTITREDCFASAKVRQYEAMLHMENYQDIRMKTRKCNLPLFHKLPYGLEQLSHGELASYIRKIIEEDMYG